VDPNPSKRRTRVKAAAGKGRLGALRRARHLQGILAQVVVRPRRTLVGSIPRAGRIEAANDPEA